MDFNVTSIPDFVLFYFRAHLEPKSSKCDRKTVLVSLKEVSLDQDELSSDDLSSFKSCFCKNRFEAKNMIINSL